MTNEIRQLRTPVTIPVSGVSFHQGVVRSLSEGDKLVLQRDRDNEYDANAIAVYTLDGAQVGFVPRNIAERFVNSADERWGGRISELLVGKTWGIRLRVTHSNVPAVPLPSVPVAYSPVTEPAEVDADAGREMVHVYARSGRLLGTLDPESSTDVSVAVCDEQGQVSRYPKALVVTGSVEAA